MRYRASCTLMFDFESDLNPDQALEYAKKQLDEIKICDNIDIIKSVTQIDKLKSKVEKIKLGEFPLNEVLPFITHEPLKKEYVIGEKTFRVKMNTDRYHVFKNNMQCVSCGLMGTKFILECHPSDMQPHFNLYGEEDKKLILFTKDHIQAKAFGGEDKLHNYQTMCCICNSLKAHSNLNIQSVSALRKIFDENKKKISKKKLHFLIEDERKKMELPWPHTIYSNSEKPKNGVQVLEGLILVEIDKQMIAATSDQVQEQVHKGYIEKGSYLEEVLQINNYVFCKLKDDTIIKINTKYICRN